MKHPADLITRRQKREVLHHQHETPRDVLDGADKFGPDLVKLEPQHSLATVDARRALLDAEKPFIQRFEYSDVPGYSMVKVYPDRVDVDVYIGLGRDRWRSPELSRGVSPT